MCDFDYKMQTAILAWMKSGCISAGETVTSRPQKKYPNTYCIFFERPTIGGTPYPYACLDIHLNPDGSLLALGGFWINGVMGKSMKTEQATGAPTRKAARAQLLARVPSPAPGHGITNYKAKRDALRAAAAAGAAAAAVPAPVPSPPAAVTPPSPVTPPAVTGDGSGA